MLLVSVWLESDSKFVYRPIFSRDGKQVVGKVLALKSEKKPFRLGSVLKQV